MKLFKNSYWIRSGFFTILRRMSTVLFGFVSFFILIRVVSKDEFGSWVVFISITALIETMRNGFFRNAVVKFIAEAEEKDYPKVFTSAFVLNVLLTVIISTVLVLFSSALATLLNTPLLKELLSIYAITNIIYSLFSHFEYLSIANLDFKASFYGYLVKQVTFVLYILSSLVLGFDIDIVNLAGFQVLSTLFGALTLFFLAKKFLRYSFVIDKTRMVKMVNYGKYTFATNIASMVFGSVDQWMLSSMLSPVAVGIYNPALRINNLIEVPTWSVTTTVFPQLSRRIKEEGVGASKYLYEKSVGLILSIIIPALILIFIFAEEVIYIIAGADYGESVPILRVTMLYCLFIPFGRQFGVVMDATGKPQVSFMFIIIQMIINVISNYFFIKYFGIIGAAYGTLLTFFIGFIINQIYLKRAHNILFWRTLKYSMSFYQEGFLILRKRYHQLKKN